MEWRPEVWGAPWACLLSSSPYIESFPSLGPWEGPRVQRPGSSLTLAQMLVGLGGQATMSPCVPRPGPRACPPLGPESCVTDSPESKLKHFPFLGPAQASSPQGQQKREAGSWGDSPSPPSVLSALSQKPSHRIQPWVEEEKAMYPIATPMECAPTGMRQKGHPGRAPTGRGTGSNWGPGALLGGGRGFPNLDQLSRSSILPPRPPQYPGDC